MSAVRNVYVGQENAPGDGTPGANRAQAMQRATPRGEINLRLGSYLNRLGDGRFYSIGPEAPLREYIPSSPYEIWRPAPGTAAALTVTGRVQRRGAEPEAGNQIVALRSEAR